MTRRLRGTNVQVTAATLLLLLALIPGRELIPHRDGIGYDGIAYARWTEALSFEMLFATVDERPQDLARYLNDYRVHRILVPIAFHYLFRWVDAKPTTQNIIWAYTAANILFLGLGVFLWCRSADVLAIGDSGKWLGFIALMVNYANAKMPLYYPVLLDSAAMAWGAAMLLQYLESRRIGLMAATLLGTFVWPSLPYFGLLLIAFPYAREERLEPAPHRLDRIAAAGTAAAAVCIIAFLFAWGYDIEATPVEPLVFLAPLSAGLVAAYLYFGMRPLMDSKALWLDLSPGRALRSPWPWAALLLHGTGVLLVAMIPTSPSPMGVGRAVADNFMSAVAQPGIAWVAHALYYGPLVLMVLFLWPRISENVRRRGTGLVLCFALAVVLGAGSESRKLMNFYPAIVLFLVPVAAPLVASRGRIGVLLGLSFLASKIWLPMDEPRTIPLLGDVTWRDLYVSSRGPWIDHGWWAVQGIAVLAVAAWLYFGCVRRPLRPSC